MKSVVHFAKPCNFGKNPCNNGEENSLHEIGVSPVAHLLRTTAEMFSGPVASFKSIKYMAMVRCVKIILVMDHSTCRIGPVLWWNYHRPCSYKELFHCWGKRGPCKIIPYWQMTVRTWKCLEYLWTYSYLVFAGIIKILQL